MVSNFIKLEIAAMSENVALARTIVAAFITPIDPTVGELTDIKTAVSEAVTNAIIHGYNDKGGTVKMTLAAENREITIIVSDSGIGIENVASAREPLFTTKPDMERSGMGFTVMESFMDKVEVVSRPGEGTTITMTRTLGA